MSSMVVCPEPLAAQLGQEVFAAGGNAVDAAIATAFAQAVVSPLLCGLGGTGIMNYYDARKRQGIVLDFEVTVGSRPVTEAWPREYLGRAETVGRYIIRSEANQVGYQSVMTPGFVRGCWIAFHRFGSGRISWADLLSPAALLAQDGFPASSDVWQDTDASPGYPSPREKLNATPDARRIFLKPDGSLLKPGDHLVQMDLARTIQRIADYGADDFYCGGIAQTIAEDFASHAGTITADDLREYSVRADKPLVGSYRGYPIHCTPVLSSGPTVLEMLNILEHFDLAGMGHNSPEYIDTVARVQRAAFVDKVRLKCLDLEQAKQLEQDVIGPGRAEYWAQRIKSGDRIMVRGGVVDPGTTHVSCVDEKRNIVSFTHSIGSLAGSGVVTPGLGFLYNNFLGHYNPLPGYPDSLRPGKRWGGGVPTIVFKDGDPYIAIGAPGGSRIMSAVVQSIVNVIDHGMDMNAAVCAPRFHSEEQQLILLEPSFDEHTARILCAKGNRVDRSTYMARVQAIRVNPSSGELEAGPDPRGGGGVGSSA